MSMNENKFVDVYKNYVRNMNTNDIVKSILLYGDVITKKKIIRKMFSEQIYIPEDILNTAKIITMNELLMDYYYKRYKDDITVLENKDIFTKINNVTISLNEFKEKMFVIDKKYNNVIDNEYDEVNNQYTNGSMIYILFLLTTNFDKN